MTSTHGRCACGKISFQAELAAKTVMNCHCRDCQRATGSPYASFVSAPQASMVVEGEPASFTVTGESGGAVERFFCRDCGSQLWSRVDVVPGMAFVKVGCLDQRDGLALGVQIWTASKPHWLELDPNAPTFDKNPTT